MYCKSELLAFVLNDHAKFHILNALLTGKMVPQPILGRMLDRLQSWSAHNAEDRILLPLLKQTIIRWLSTCSLVAILTNPAPSTERG